VVETCSRTFIYYDELVVLMVPANYFARYKYLHKAMGWDSHDMNGCSALFIKLCNKEAVLVFRLECDCFPS